MTKKMPSDRRLEKDCGYCGGPIVGRRADSLYCSASCRVTAEKRRRKERLGGGPIHFRGPNTGRTLDKKEYNLKRKYGINLEKYNQLLKKQNNCCAICDKHKDEFKINLAVDHNHITGEIRGLLCSYCNRYVIGRHRDGNLLRKMAAYVEQGTGLYVPKKKRPVKRKPKRN